MPMEVKKKHQPSATTEIYGNFLLYTLKQRVIIYCLKFHSHTGLNSIERSIHTLASEPNVCILPFSSLHLGKGKTDNNAIPTGDYNRERSTAYSILVTYVALPAAIDLYARSDSFLKSDIAEESLQPAKIWSPVKVFSLILWNITPKILRVLSGKQ